jgi:IclR family acetate operon transcriptional repressor
MLKPVQSVERALGLLELIDAAGSEGIGLSELANGAELKTPTAHNLLNTLIALGYIRRSERSKRYRLGPQALALGQGRTAMDRLVAAARRPLSDLLDEVNETIILAAYRGGRRHTIFSLESRRDLRVGAPLGADLHFYGTATGRSLLAQLDEDELAAIAERLGPRATEWPEAADDAQLAGMLASIADTGVAELHKDHIEALAVPIPLSSSGMKAALGLFYPAVRDTPERRRTLVDALCKAAREVQAEHERMRS